jgi:hypothetical protein
MAASASAVIVDRDIVARHRRHWREEAERIARGEPLPPPPEPFRESDPKGTVGRATPDAK